jgi:hypothetical protein
MCVLETLFSGLTLQNWLSGGPLLNAWRKSLDQMRVMVFEIKDENPVVLYMRYSVFDPTAKWVKIMNTGDNSNELISCPKASRDEWANYARSQIDQAVETLRQKISEFVDGAPRASAPQNRVSQEMARPLVMEKVRGQREMQREREDR